VIGATRAGMVGVRDRALSKRLEGLVGSAALHRTPTQTALEAACVRRDPQQSKVWVGLYAVRNLDRLLEQAALAHGLTLSLDAPPRGGNRMAESFRLSALDGVEITAEQSRQPLLRALRRLDWTIFALGGGILSVALGVALVVSRGLARPIADLAEQTRNAAGQEPQPLRVRGGGRELQQLAQAFNAAISDLRELSRRLAASERESARREIAERVAHEIKNPLAPIRAAIETLRRLRARDDPAFDAYFDEATRTALDEVRRINDIVTEFTRFARLPRPKPRPFELTEAVASVVSLHGSAGVPVRIDAPERLELCADRDQIVQVLTNLLKNAIDACSGVEQPRIVVTLEADDERVRLGVADNGPGVEPELVERLFEPYVTTKPSGTGLGLAIVERIVIEHGGAIHYQEAEQGGACFVVELPRAVAPDAS
jgi:nitrogen fixation/metabolism regulation signal transduction histidine kinase